MPIILAQAEPPPSMTQPRWERLPSQEQLERYYPKDAARNRVEGRATVQCSVSAEGKLVDCSVLQEEPAGSGFGAAATSLATTSFSMRPKSRDGKSVVGGIVRIPIHFVPPPASAAQSNGGGESELAFEASKLSWRIIPSGEDFARVFPSAAMARGVVGQAVLDCMIQGDGTLVACNVTTEEPSGLGFGAAAVRLSAKFKASLEADASIAGKHVRLPLRFDLPRHGH